MFQTGITASSLAPDLRESVRLARTLRFKGVLLDAVGTSADLTNLSQSGKREVSHIVSSNDLQLIGLRATIDRAGLNKHADVDQQLSRIERAMEAAKGLQSPLVCVDLRQLPQVTTPPKPRSAISPELAGVILIPKIENQEPEEPIKPTRVDTTALSHVQAVLLELGARADRYSVQLAFSAGLSSFASLAWAIEVARCPWFGVDLNPVDALRDDWSMEEIFSALSGHFAHVQIKDAICGNDRRTQPAMPGRGDVKWNELFQHLRESDYQGWLTVDPTEQPDRMAAAQTGLALCTSAAR